MKIQLLAALFISALVAVPCLADDETPNNDAPSGGGVVVNGGLQQESQDQPENGIPEDELEDPSPPVENGQSQGDENEEEEEEDEEDDNDADMPKELQDEAERVKRRLLQLSHKSCLILKKLRYCRFKGIANLCIRQCKPCKNLLSYQSCRSIKNKYNKCRFPIGRKYCRFTCKLCGRPKWRDYKFYWCGIRNRIYIRSKVSFKKCKDLCTKRRGCKAVEWWGKYNFNCYVCKNPRLRKRYTNSRDLAWPPHVGIMNY